MSEHRIISHVQLRAELQREGQFGFLLVDKFSMFSLAAAIDCFRSANRLLGRDFYGWTTISADGDAVLASNGLPLMVSHDVGAIPLADVLFVAVGLAIDFPGKAKVLDNKIGYIKLNDFSANSTAELEKGLKQIDAKHLNGLIFDLRDDPGGFLRQAIEVARAFMKSGPIVIQRGRPGTQDIKLQATGDLFVPETVPMVVLINENSASASELVSGALKDYKRAIIVGVKSYGKGSVQSWMELNNGGALRLTTAHFFTPLGNAVHEIGITPDVIVEWKLSDRESNPDDDPQLAKALEILSKGVTAPDTAKTSATATPVK